MEQIRRLTLHLDRFRQLRVDGEHHALSPSRVGPPFNPTLNYLISEVDRREPPRTCEGKEIAREGQRLPCSLHGCIRMNR